MASRLRSILALGIVLAMAGLLAFGRLGPSRQPRGSTARLKNSDCRQCHQQVFAEWESSYHAKSFVDDAVQASFAHFGHDRKCQTCHAPEPVFVTGLGKEVALRADNRESGVDCLSCHALPDGASVAASRTIVDAPCRPVEVPALAKSESCADCHTAIYKDWAASRYVGRKTCQDCHMPQVARGGKQGSGGDEPGGAGRGAEAPHYEPTGRSHVCLGGHDDALVRSGATMKCRQEAGELVVSVTNHATGHNFPGERHNRQLYLQVIQRNAAGEITLAQQSMIKGITPFRGETSAEKIKVDETHEARFPVVSPPVTAEVQLLYKRFPWHPDREALIVHQESVPLEAP